MAFDEAAYLRRHPDVVAAIAAGKYRSGREHFERFGRAEGRTWSARPLAGAEVAFGPVGDFTAPVPGPPRHVIDSLIVAEEGWLLVVGWANDTYAPLRALRIDGRDWSARVQAKALARVPRGDVQEALDLPDSPPLGLMVLIHAGARLSPVREARIAFEWDDGQATVLVVPARMAGARELLDSTLRLLARNTSPPALIAMDGGFGEQLAALARAVSVELVGNPLIERFGETVSAPKVSAVVCLYGRAEHLFTQNALFAGRPGVEDIEFIYVCNSPELLERLLKDARCGTAIYGLRQTIVGLPGNAGFAAATNLGVRLARADRVICLNPDVYPRDAAWAERHAAIVEGGGDGNRLFGGTLFYDDGALMHGGMYFELDTMLAVRAGFVQAVPFARVEHYGKGAPPETEAFLRPRPVPAVSGAFLSIDRAWFEQLGGFAEEYVLGHYEDADLCLRSLQAGVVPWLQDVRMWHLESQGSPRSPQLAGAALANRALFSRRWRGVIAERLAGPDAQPAPAPIQAVMS